jgi:hypothetical protein
MAPDEDSMPDPSGTGAVGAPSPDEPGSAPGATTPPATTPATGEGANAGAPIDASAPMGGATPAG